MVLYTLAPLRHPATLQRTSSLDRPVKLLLLPHELGLGMGRRRGPSPGTRGTDGGGPKAGEGSPVVRHNSAPEQGFPRLSEQDVDTEFAAQVDAAYLKAISRRKQAAAQAERTEGEEGQQEARSTEATPEVAECRERVKAEENSCIGGCDGAVGCDGRAGCDGAVGRIGEQPETGDGNENELYSRAAEVTGVVSDCDEEEAGQGSGCTGSVPQDGNGEEVSQDGNGEENNGGRRQDEDNGRDELAVGEVPDGGQGEAANGVRPQLAAGHSGWPDLEESNVGSADEEAKADVSSVDPKSPQSATCHGDSCDELDNQPSPTSALPPLPPHPPFGSKSTELDYSSFPDFWVPLSLPNLSACSLADPELTPSWTKERVHHGGTATPAFWKGRSTKAARAKSGPLPFPYQAREPGHLQCQVAGPNSASSTPDGRSRFLRPVSRKLREASQRLPDIAEYAGCFPLGRSAGAKLRDDASWHLSELLDASEEGPEGDPVIARDYRWADLVTTGRLTGMDGDARRRIWGKLRGRFKRMGSSSKVFQGEGVVSPRA